MSEKTLKRVCRVRRVSGTPARLAGFAACLVSVFMLWQGGAGGLRADYVASPYILSTFAGYAGSGSADGPSAEATFNRPNGVAVDAAGNVYLADSDNSIIRKISTTGEVTTLAGTAGADGYADGAGAGALFYRPYGIAVNAAGTQIFVSDTLNHVIRKLVVNPTTGAVQVSSLAGFAGQTGTADGNGVAARFNQPTGLALSADGASLYVADTGNQRIRKVATSDGQTVAVVSGVGLVTPLGLALSGDGTALYIADKGAHVVRRITLNAASGTFVSIATLAGQSGTSGGVDGTGTAARFDEPTGLAVSAGGLVYVTDANGCLIRRIDPTTAAVTTLAGAYRQTGSTNATGAAARFTIPTGLLWQPGTGGAPGRLLLADNLNSQIRALDLSTLAVTTLAGRDPLRGGAEDGTGAGARFDAPRDIARDAAGNLYLTDRDNHLIRKITPVGVVTTMAGVADSIGSADAPSGPGSSARFNTPSGIAVKADGSVIYVADRENHTIRQITAAGVVTTLAGTAGLAGAENGTGAAARFNQPSSLALDSAGNLYVADFSNHAIRKITPGGVVTTLAGALGLQGYTEGLGSLARFKFPVGLCVTATGEVFVADRDNGVIRKLVVNPTTEAVEVSTYVTGLAIPYDVAVDGSGRLYVLDYLRHLVYRKDSAGAPLQEMLGSLGQPGASDGIANAGRLRNPEGLTVDAAGNVFIADTGNDTVRYANLVPTPVITSAASISGTADIALAPFTITASAGATQFAAHGLPPGLSLAETTGVISGIPTQSGTFLVAVSATNLVGSGNATLTLTIAPSPFWTVSTLRAGLPLTSIEGMAVDAAGTVYFSDLNADIIYKRTSDGVESAWVTSLNQPTALAAAPDGTLFAAEYGANAVRKISPGGQVTTLVEEIQVYDLLGQPEDFSVFTPAGLVLAPGGQVLWFFDQGNNVLLSYNLNTNTLAKLTLTGEVASGILIHSLALTNEGVFYASVPEQNRILKIQANGATSVFAGPSTGSAAGSTDGLGSLARFNQPLGLTLDSTGNLYVTDSGNQTLRRITPAGDVFTIAGSVDNVLPAAQNGKGSAARFNTPMALAFGPDGRLFVADVGNLAVRIATAPPVFPVFTSASALSATEGLGYPVFSVTATGPVNTYSASNLPPGLNLNSTTGQITGTPTESGIYNATLLATNSLGTAESDLVFTITAPTWTAWQNVNFTSGEFAQTVISGPAADPDGDGLCNLLEYVAASNPKLRDFAPPELTLTNGYLELSFYRRRSLTGWRFTVEVSNDLITWNSGPAYVQEVGVEVVDPRREKVRVRSLTPLSNGSRLFIRMNLTPNP